MYITTSSGHEYFYLRQTNEIVDSGPDDDWFAWEFEPLSYFTALPNVDTFIISITEQCNLRCLYCCYSGNYKNNRSHNTSSMSKRDIDEVFSFIQNTVGNKEIRLAFYGGEPLLQPDLLRYAIDKAHVLWKDKVSISVSSNATLLTPAIIDWLFDNKVRIDISIDGHKKVHDRQRRYSNGKGTFEKVYEALSYIREQHSSRLQDGVLILMTLAELDDLIEICFNWQEDSLLKEIIPTKISSISPNFRCGVERTNYEALVKKYLSLLEVYESHRELKVLKVFLEQCIAYWVNRPIIDVGGAVPMATCLPINNRVYVN